MERNHPNMEKFNQIKWSSDDQSGSSQARSYTCSFCKRGFSNAQALGGHMNIHRRDRARIRQFSEENQLSSSETMKKANPVDHDPKNNNALAEKACLQSEFLSDHVQQSGMSYNNNNNPFWLNKREDVQAIHRGKVGSEQEIINIQQLPLLFVEEPSENDNKKVSGCGSQSEEKLDLELRLGPDPDHHDKSTTTPLSAREFF